MEKKSQHVVGHVKGKPLRGRRLCSCRSHRLNCMSGSEWVKAQVAVWQVKWEPQDLRDRALHPAPFPIALPRRIIELFTHAGELVLDPFCGSGTTLLAARALNRSAVGLDLNDDYCQLARSRLQSIPPGQARQQVVNEDARNVRQWLDRDSVQLSFTSPPFANLLTRVRQANVSRAKRSKLLQRGLTPYSDSPADLGNLPPRPFLRALRDVYAGIYDLTAPGGHAVVEISDIWWQNRRVLLHLGVIQALTHIGFEFQNTVIWDRTNLVHRVGIFGWPSRYIAAGTNFDYVLHFTKPRTIETGAGAGGESTT